MVYPNSQVCFFKDGAVADWEGKGELCCYPPLSLSHCFKQVDCLLWSRPTLTTFGEYTEVSTNKQTVTHKHTNTAIFTFAPESAFSLYLSCAELSVLAQKNETLNECV